MSKPHQRVGSVSNAHVGADFERVALECFAKQGIVLSRNFPVELGLSKKKVHCFDLGTAKDKVIVECKSHRWTAGVGGRSRGLHRAVERCRQCRRLVRPIRLSRNGRPVCGGTSQRRWSATASTQPIPALKLSRDEYLAQATSAYQEVVDKFSDQSLNLICAQFGLAAVAENRSDWPGATNHYQAVLTNENSSPTQKLYAQQRINILPELNHPALLVNAETAPLVSATQPTVPSTTQSILKQATQPATLPK